MKKETKRLIILLGVSVVLLIMAVIFAGLPKKETSQGLSEITVPGVNLWEYGTSDIKKILVKNDEEYSITPYEGGFIIEGFEEFSENEHAYVAAVGISQLSEVRLITNDTTRYGDYGLADPLASAEVFFTGDVQEGLYFGKESADNKFIYVRTFDEGSPVFALPLSEYSVFLQPSFYYLSNDIAPFSADSSGISIEKIEYTYAAALPIVIENGEGGYVISSPIKRSVDISALEGLLQTANVLQGENFSLHPSDEELAGFGLLEPSAKMKVFYKDKESGESGEYEILVGGESEEAGYANRYVSLAGRDIVYIVGEAAVPWTHYTPENLMSYQLFNFDIADVSAITISGSGAFYRFELDNEGATGPVLISEAGQKELLRGNFLKLIKLLNSGRGEGLFSESEMGLAALILEIKIDFKDELKEALVLEFFHKEGAQAYAWASDLGNEKGMSVSYAYLLKILEVAEKVSKDEEVLSVLW